MLFRNKMNNQTFFKKSLVIFLVILFSFLFFGTNVFADQESNSASIQAEVPSQQNNQQPPSGGGGGGGGTDSNPDITNVTTTPMLNSAAVQWKATDDNKLDRCDLSYGLAPNLNKTTSSIEVTSTIYKSELKNLQSDSLYEFKIECYDDNNQISTKSGDFKTYKTAKVNLKIKAKPEKRVDKQGGNLDTDFNFFLIATSSNKSVYKISGTTNSSGTWKKKQISINSGQGYKAVLKGKSHLSKRVTGINISDGQDLTINFSDKSVLQAGDVAGNGLKDNFIDILDLSAVQNRLNTSNKEADLNRDGIVDVLDISILMNNFNDSGDQLPTTI